METHKKNKIIPYLSTSFGGSPDLEFSAHGRVYISKQSKLADMHNKLHHIFHKKITQKMKD
jgi:hypothetical protein